MSDFLANLLRRGAGLQPVVVPRRPEVPGEPFPDGDTAEELPQAALAEPVPVAPEPVHLPAEAGRIEAPPVAPPPQTVQTVAAPKPSPGLSAKPIPAPERYSPMPPAPPRPEQASARQELPVVTTMQPRATPTLGRAAMPAFEPEPQPPVLPAALAATAAPEPPSPVLGRSEDLALPPPPAPSPVPVEREETWPAVAVQPSPEAVAIPEILREAAEPEEPRIEVRIGRIEILQAPPPPPPALAPRREPRGFADHTLARRYLDRRWS